MTRRLREGLEQAVSGSLRSAADVAREYDVSRWSVNAALVAMAAQVLGPAPAGVSRLGVDAPRVRRVRWLLEQAGWRRPDPWMTSFVDLDPGRPGGLLGLAPGRSGASVRGWLGLQSEKFRAGIGVFTWTTPTGRSHERRPPAIAPPRPDWKALHQPAAGRAAGRAVGRASPWPSGPEKDRDRGS